MEKKYAKHNAIHIISILALAVLFNSNPTSANTITDADGNIYHTVTIGTQTWTVENLKTTHYNDGTAIPLISDSATWFNLTTQGYCWYDNDELSNKNAYGALYNWYAVNTDRLTPKGWHIPTDAEWDTLSTYLGGEFVSGEKLKETGTTHWNPLNTGATNETGFSALPGGYRYSNGSFYGIGYSGYWCSATENDASNVYNRYIYSTYGSLGRSGKGNKSNGYSVRLVKD